MPFVLVGTQIDLRDDAATLETLKKHKTQQTPITFEQGEQLAEEMNAVKFVECSALAMVIQFRLKYWAFFVNETIILQKGLKEVFDEAIKAVMELSKKNKIKRKCKII